MNRPTKSATTLQKLWPPELLYWRRMGSREISDYVQNTEPDKRLVLITWGVLEAHGPWLPVASDSMMAEVATNKVADIFRREHGVNPIVVDGFKDIGSYSATRDLPGAIAIEGWEQYTSGQYSPILHMWEEFVARLKREGFNKFFLVNGDGGNWMNYVERPWESGFRSMLEDIRDKHGVLLDGANWDQEGGEPWKHAGHHEHALVNWLCWFAPEFERLAAMRAGMKPVSEENLQTIDGAGFGDLESEVRRRSNWADFPEQLKLRGVTEFFFAKYKALLYEDNGTTPKATGGIAADFDAKIQKLMARILKIVTQRTPEG